MLTPNPGGILAPDQVVGRDALISLIWRRLEQQGVVLSAERRMGKTSILKKMEDSPPPGVLARYYDLEAIHTPLEFVQAVTSQVESDLRTSEQIVRRMKEWYSRLLGIQIQLASITILPQDVAPHWKEALETLFSVLADQQDQNVIFLWDELPTMIDNIRRNASEAVAMELLDTLRALRNRHPRLRMVFTGSIGLHLVLAVLRKSGHANPATNDMYECDVPPLALSDAQMLAKDLLANAGIQVLNPIATAAAIAQTVDGMPFFIHSVVEQLIQQGTQVNVSTIEAVVAAALTDPHDRWQLGYYRERLDRYYVGDDRIIVLGVLDALAPTHLPLSVNDLHQLLLNQQSTSHTNRDRLLELLRLLARDHYLTRTHDGRYSFRFPLIARAWLLHRGLS